MFFFFFGKGFSCSLTFRICNIQITLPYDALELSKATKNMAAIYLACGVDTSKV